MDANRRSRYGWMGLGAMVCLLAVGLALKVRDPNRAHAQAPADGPVLPPPTALPEKDVPPAALPPVTSDALPLPAPSDTPPPPLAGMPLPVIKPVAAQELPGVSPPTGSESRPIQIPAIVPPPEAVPPPPVAPPPAPVVVPPAAPTVKPVTGVVGINYKVKSPGMTFKTLARRTLGSAERWPEIAGLNPDYPAEKVFPVGTFVVLPADAVIADADDGLTALPSLRARPAPRPKAALPLTGSYAVALDGRTMALPPAVLEQLGHCDTVLASPGSSRCLWVTNQAHFERLGAKLDKSPAKEADVQAFKRLYYAQITKLPVRDGRFTLTERLAAFAGLSGEVVLVGIDDHFEVWDAAAWRKFTAVRKYPAAE